MKKNHVPARSFGFALFVLLVTPGLSIAQTAFDPAQVAAGEEVYRDYCWTCHGEGLRSTAGVTFDLRRLRAADHDRFVNSVLDGKGQMPPWRGALTMVQIEAVWAYIRATVDR
jgi:mono/diheme cytochrome c family protein